MIDATPSREQEMNSKDRSSSFPLVILGVRRGALIPRTVLFSVSVGGLDVQLHPT